MMTRNTESQTNSSSRSVDWARSHKRLCESPKSLLRQLGWHATCPLLWSKIGLEHVAIDLLESRHQILKKKQSAKNQEIFLNELSSLADFEETTELLKTIQLAYSADQIAKVCDSDHLKQLAGDLSKIGINFQNQKADDDAIQQLAGVELPMVLAEQFQLSSTDAVRKMEFLIDELVDGDGWISAGKIEVFELLLCSWARCVKLASNAGLQFEDSTTIKLEWMARQWIRLLGPDGSVLLVDGEHRSVAKEMQAAILSLSSDRTDRKLVRLRIEGGKPKGKGDTKLRFHDGCGFSDWAALGVFQSGWDVHSPRVAIAASKPGLSLEIVNQISLLKGIWEPRVELDGKLIEFGGEHEVNVSHSDEEVEFVELEYTSKSGCLLQRQILFARDEQFLFLADAVIPKAEALIEYRATLPFAPNVQALLETDNREIYLKDSKIRALVLPLALGEWRSDHSKGTLDSDDGKLELRQASHGTALYAPLFLDLSPKRCTSPRTWRTLTVAEELTILGPDKAAAYRVQIGDQQWVFYRSLSGIASRTFLGENQMCEFFVGKFDGDTAADELIQLE